MGLVVWFVGFYGVIKALINMEMVDVADGDGIGVFDDIVYTIIILQDVINYEVITITIMINKYIQFALELYKKDTNMEWPNNHMLKMIDVLTYKSIHFFRAAMGNLNRFL